MKTCKKLKEKNNNSNSLNMIRIKHNISSLFFENPPQWEKVGKLLGTKKKKVGKKIKTSCFIELLALLLSSDNYRNRVQSIQNFMTPPPTAYCKGIFRLTWFFYLIFFSCWMTYVVFDYQRTKVQLNYYYHVSQTYTVLGGILTPIFNKTNLLLFYLQPMNLVWAIFSIF